MESYNYRMNKRAISVTLSPDNLLWLRARALAAGRKSVSETLDQIVRDVRSGPGKAGGPVRSVVGMVRIAESDPDLRKADAAIRALFATSLARTSRLLNGAGISRGKRRSRQRGRRG